MMNWLTRILGKSQPKPVVGPVETYQEFEIQATPQDEGGQFRVAGIIRQNGQEKMFVRSDLVPDRGQAEQISLAKARLIIDQRGAKLFDEGHL